MRGKRNQVARVGVGIGKSNHTNPHFDSVPNGVAILDFSTGGKRAIPEGFTGVIFQFGVQQWCQGGKLHREGDSPAVIYAGGRKEWWQHGLLHRDNDKPAWIDPISHSERWYKDGKLHRLVGPAMISPPEGGHSHRYYWIGGSSFSKEDWEARVEVLNTQAIGRAVRRPRKRLSSLTTNPES